MNDAVAFTLSGVQAVYIFTAIWLYGYGPSLEHPAGPWEKKCLGFLAGFWETRVEAKLAYKALLERTGRKHNEGCRHLFFLFEVAPLLAPAFGPRRAVLEWRSLVKVPDGDEPLQVSFLPLEPETVPENYRTAWRTAASGSDLAIRQMPEPQRRRAEAALASQGQTACTRHEAA